MTNGMILNPIKCTVITFSRGRNVTSFNYSVRGIAIERSQHVKDLGVWLDTKMTMNVHIDKVVASSRRVLGLVKRFCRELGDDVGTARQLYLTLVRPILEYAVVAWCPSEVTKVNRLESVQKQFLLWVLRRKYPDFRNLPPYQLRL